jgi:fatty acid desaturase
MQEAGVGTWASQVAAKEYPQRPAVERRAERKRRARRTVSNATLVWFLVFALGSVALYGAFFTMIGPLSALYTAQTEIAAAAVVGSALVFSLIHGTFAKYLLDVLGFKGMH